MLKNIKTPGYLDIGAYHPFALSNTAKFYLKGSRGVTVEPNPDQYGYFKLHRKRDINLNIGIGDSEGDLLYYKMNQPTMNTFDAVTAKDLVEKHGFQIKEEIRLPVKKLNDIVEKYCSNKFPDLLSLDVEGLDEQILKQIDYNNNFPYVICVETIEYTNDGTGKRNLQLIEFLKQKGYIEYANTFINSIFVHGELWAAKAPW